MDSQDIPIRTPLLFSGGKFTEIINSDSPAIYNAVTVNSAGIAIEPYGEASFSRLIDVYREIFIGLDESCGAIDSLPALWDMRASVLAAKKTGKRIFVILQTNDEGETADGTLFCSALIVLQELGISAFGIRGGSPQSCTELIKQIFPYAHVPLIAVPDAAFMREDKYVQLTPEEYKSACLELICAGAEILGAGKGADEPYISALAQLLSCGSRKIDIQKQDTSLVFATADQMFFLDPETTEFSPAIECSPDMYEIITAVCEESYDVLTVAVNSPDDAIDFARQMNMATLPAAFLSDDEISLKMALMLYQGRAIVDTKSLIAPEELKKIADKYGAVLY